VTPQQQLASHQRMKKVVVLDRDGTIVVDRHYLADPEALEFEADAESGLRRMSELGYRLVIITNQSGIARGLFSVSKLEEIHQRLRLMLHEIGVPLAGIYYCPHGQKDACECRKPNLGLMRQAAEELGFDSSESIVIGDKESDVEFGRRAGAVTMLIAKSASRSVPSTAADYIVESLKEAADIIARRTR